MDKAKIQYRKIKSIPNEDLRLFAIYKAGEPVFTSEIKTVWKAAEERTGLSRALQKQRFFFKTVFDDGLYETDIAYIEKSEGNLTMYAKGKFFDKPYVRFIEPDYTDLFLCVEGEEYYISDFSGTTFVRERKGACHFIDSFHNCWHICEFAERLESGQRTVMFAPDAQVRWIPEEELEMDA